MGSLQKLLTITKSCARPSHLGAVCVAYARIHTTSHNVGVDSIGVFNDCSIGLGRLFDHVRDVLDRLQPKGVR